MKVAVKHQIDLWVEVDLKEQSVDRVVVDDTDVGRPVEYRVILKDPPGAYDTTRYPGRKMAKAARKVVDTAEWPPWQTGWE